MTAQSEDVFTELLTRGSQTLLVHCSGQPRGTTRRNYSRVGGREVISSEATVFTHGRQPAGALATPSGHVRRSRAGCRSRYAEAALCNPVQTVGVAQSLPLHLFCWTMRQEGTPPSLPLCVNACFHVGACADAESECRMGLWGSGHGNLPEGGEAKGLNFPRQPSLLGEEMTASLGGRAEGEVRGGSVGVKFP